MTLITPTEAAQRLGISAVRVRQLIHAGKLPARAVGRFYMIELKDLKLLNGRQAGRPKKG